MKNHPITRRTMALLFMFLLLYTCIASADSTPLKPTDYQAIVQNYQHAHRDKNLAALESMFYSDRMPAALFSRVLQHLAKGFDRELQSVTVSKVSDDWPMSYDMNNTRYQPNLAPEAQLVIQFVKGSGIKESKLLIGSINKRKYLINFVPNKKP